MNKRNTRNKGSVVAWIIVLALLLFGGYYFFIREAAPTTTVTVETENQPVPSGAPSAATKNASQITPTSVALAGEVNPNGAQTAYWYEYGKTNSMGSNTTPQLVGAGSFNYSAPAILTGLTANTDYYFRLIAENQNGKVSGSILRFKTGALVSTSPAPTPAPQLFPPTVQTTNAGEVSTTTAKLHGEVNPKGVATIYWFEYGTGFGLGRATAVSSIDAANTSIGVSATLSSLSSSTTYYYRLNAQNAYGTVNGSISVFTTAPSGNPTPPVGNAPNAVTGVAAIVTADGATLNGQVDPEGSVATYRFEYGKATPFGAFELNQRTADVNAGSGTALVSVQRAITGLDADSTYYYRVLATNGYGSTYGAILSFRTSDE